ncbi:MAG TPA: DUF488 domain-containing protein [Leptospiraceae bacterium]|nr:DUF488 domain-containing protein [Leptospiraceae bacterium]HNI99712.1 DUF488 domain-containing protein [Leptospiraceae bacterium]HNM04008.1 DUF488 domain-containing protein [Leptospiraceae bacterium]
MINIKAVKEDIMYYRRKIILALLKTFNGKLSNSDLQNLLFLFAQRQLKPSFDFLPFRSGCHSPQANQDLKTMIKYNMVKEEADDWILADTKNYIQSLNKKDQQDLPSFASEYSDLRGVPLMRYVYKKYPFYAIKTEYAESILSSEEMAAVNSVRPRNSEPALFTVGYEGKSVEQYVTQLIKEDIKILCDIRKNPMSMKFGFSKSQLKGILEGAGIDYVHIPGLGIDSGKRQNLKTQNDYEKLFAEYEKTTLIQNKSDLAELANLFRKNGRIALTCFESDHHSCHRSRTANALHPLLPKNTPLVHL